MCAVDGGRFLTLDEKKAAQFNARTSGTTRAAKRQLCQRGHHATKRTRKHLERKDTQGVGVGAAPLLSACLLKAKKRHEFVQIEDGKYYR